LELRSERLRLRLPTDAELLDVMALARAGIHPPDEMPFAIAWTDASSEPGFVDGFAAFHEEALATWTPERWMLNLIAFADGEPVGTQGIGAMGFATERTVETGSWLGAASQGHGLGTEMRVAVLELAFGVLGAVAARSGWSEGGAGQSARVSARLGYRETGTHILRPRDEPVVQHDLLLERDEWRCPIDVELEAVGPCLPLFGAPPDPRLATDQIARLAGS
jgi:RimJ/RimL family protein N-acetyltransferase